jgi:predicted membrane-bound spermidine synthase
MAKRKSRHQREPEREPAPFETLFVSLTSFLVGGIILVVEIVGTRIMSPYYGASIYVWSSLIGVTLASLAGGYLLGGYVADRWPGVDTLAAELIGAAIFLVLIPWFRRDVLIWSTPLGLKAGSIVGAALLFAPPLVVLGMTGPLAIRLVTMEFTVLGRGVGWIYGISTLGSMVGSILTGFVLIPNFSVRTLLIALAAVLLVMGGGGLLLSRRALAAGGTAVLALIACAPLGTTATWPSNVVYLANSFYGELKVVDVRNVRLLLINGVDNGLVDRLTFDSLAPYISYFDYLPGARPQARRALFIGLGSGSTPRAFYLRYGLASKVVEIDPAILDIARKYFDLPANVPVILEDGRRYVERTDERYDFVVLDAFNSELHPTHLFTREFFESVDRILTPGGVFAINVLAMPHAEPDAWRAVYATLRERFSHIRIFLGDDLQDRSAIGYTNMFFVASHESLPPAEPGRGGNPRETQVLAQMAQHEMVGRPEPGVGVVLTDDYNPLDDLQRRMFVLWRQDVIRKTSSVLLFDGSGW